MNAQIPSTSVKHSIVVEAPIDRAFEVFTREFGSYLYDRGVDGSECRWARVLAYDPPNRVLLTWNISPRWQIESDPERFSEWEVRPIPETPHRTRVEIEHRKLERHGEGWESVRDGVTGDRGWPLYLHRYSDVVARRQRW